jgi:DNA adenine methylase
MAVPHVIPYQGSKRLLAPAILTVLQERRLGKPVRRLYEPFGGSAALTLAAAQLGVAQEFVLADSYAPLMALWQAIVEAPAELAAAYRQTWQAGNYAAVRTAFHAEPTPERLLYLLTRCVKAAVRFNRQGAFNQAADKRRLGTHPDRLERAVLATSALLHTRAVLRIGDALQTTADAQAGDVAYLDPPWHGTTVGRDARYHAGYDAAQLHALIASLHDRGVLVLLSYDGKRAGHDFAQALPDSLQRLDLPAMRSAQATLLGRAEWTTESLYVSR